MPKSVGWRQADRGERIIARQHTIIWLTDELPHLERINPSVFGVVVPIVYRLIETNLSEIAALKREKGAQHG